MKKHFLKSAKISLILVYLVIIAGALVRMTGSGMGCPDWPKCFGHYIPPTDIKELTWSENHEFKKGQVIIKDSGLLVAKDNFTSSSTFDKSHFTPFTAHDYAEFNVTKTWIEYLNRLTGAAAGIPVFIMAVLSLWYWNENKKIVFFSWLATFMMGFQGWLGKTVVYSVLNPIKITIHMVMALLIVAVILYIIQLAKPKESLKIFNPMFRNMLWISLVLTLIQVVLGTQVRQFVDEQVKSGIGNEYLWLSKPEMSFYFHRTFSSIVLLANLFLYLKNKKLNLGFDKINWVIALIFVEVLSGIAMYCFHFPFGSQAIHLVIASILFGVQFYMILEAKKTSAQ